ncbi:hypothetical protein [Pseudomonas mandelii]|uniref:hypothetical protein n=1 Tax=Pseudomonas mandelii TaxID=75612 RepID=UPI00029AA420|nr:hypothetical protein [Pseudomonas mandelii]OYQ00829.1 hypothetical protein B7L09_27800 [Pseudomonas mandelii]
MLRLLLVFFTSFGLSFLSLWGTAGEVSPLFNNVNAVLFVLGTLFGALSLAFFNYVEGVMKDVPKKLKVKSPQVYGVVINALTDLKHEVIVNVVLVVVLFITAYVVGAFVEMAFVQGLFYAKYWVWCALSVRGACLVSVLVVLFVQAAGFMTANKLRAEISMYGE